MGLEHVRAVYEKLGSEDPLYAVLTDHSRRRNRWDPEEFFARGRDEIRAVLDHVEAGGWPLARGRALDFGAGAGRLSQALAEHFGEVVGVDISRTMVATAERYNRHGPRVRYLVNTTPDLARLEDATFDFVYSSITLQHIPPEPAAAYIGEFVRVLRAGGLAIFQTRNGPRIVPGRLRARLYALRREHLRRLWQRLRGRAPYEMHYLAQQHHRGDRRSARRPHARRHRSQPRPPGPQPALHRDPDVGTGVRGRRITSAAARRVVRT